MAASAEGACADADADVDAGGGASAASVASVVASGAWEPFVAASVPVREPDPAVSSVPSGLSAASAEEPSSEVAFPEGAFAEESVEAASVVGASNAVSSCAEAAGGSCAWLDDGPEEPVHSEGSEAGAAKPATRCESGQGLVLSGPRHW